MQKVDDFSHLKHWYLSSALFPRSVICSFALTTTSSSTNGEYFSEKEMPEALVVSVKW